MNRISFVILLSALLVLSGCAMKSAPAKTNQPAEKITPNLRSAPSPGALAAEVNAAAGGSATLREIRDSGILRAALDCSRPPLCFKDSYGVARGFEVDLLRQTADAMGVKLNIVPRSENAPVSGPVKTDPKKNEHDLVIYYYSTSTGWLAMRVNGDPGFREAVKLIWTHLYDTGTFQQLFLNRLQQPRAAGSTYKAK